MPLYPDAAAFTAALLPFLQRSPTPFHAVASCVEALTAAGFETLDEGGAWTLQADKNYLVTRNDSSIVAFNGAAVDVLRGDSEMAARGLRLFGAHTDSPCLRVKPEPVLRRQGYLQLGVEPYGGVLFGPWFDRDLSLAGRVVYRSAAGKIESTLVNWERPIAVIPSLAIHLDRTVNENRSINAQTQLPPVLMIAPASTAGDAGAKEAQVDPFRRMLCDQLQRQGCEVAPDALLDHELSFYDTQAPAQVGLRGEFVTSARLDNLLSCFIGLQAALAADGTQAWMLVFNDHEEVGSASAEGAAGPFLESVLRRLADSNEDRLARCIDRSMLISADNAHAVHPNFADRHDPNHGPALNAGPVIKVNHNQRYATNALTAGCYRAISSELGLPWQTFVTRSDLACGSTIGPITASRLGIKALDIGVPQWAMHSIREMAGVEDAWTLCRVAQAFFEREQIP